MHNGTEFVIGLDLGGTFLKYALGYPDGQLLVSKKRPSKGDQSQSAIFEVMFKAIEEMLHEAEKRRGKVIAIGVGSPGAIIFTEGRLNGNTPNLINWGNANIRKEIEEKFHLPVWADNDANVATLGEARQGAAKGCQFVIALTLGTGIGGGILINNEIYRGANFAGAELGHVSIKHDGLPCNCGGIGCIEVYASAPGMVRNYLSKTVGIQKTENITTETIFSHAKKGKPEAIATIQETCEYLGTALASFVNTFNPQLIVIGGGVADAGEDFMNQIWRELEKRAMPPCLDGVKLVRATLGNDAGVVGAICLAAEMYARSKQPRIS